MKKIFMLLLSLAFSKDAFSVSPCGVVSIEEVLTGPRHGAMMQISNKTCGGHDGWVCLDPDGQHMSQQESNRLFTFILAFHLTNKDIEVIIDESVHTSACGGTYPLLNDARTP